MKRDLSLFDVMMSPMKQELTVKRTDGADPHFQLLISQLDNELWNELKEDQATYDQYNKVSGIRTVVVLFIEEQPAACGCFKKYDANTVEIKRMFVAKPYRGKGYSKLILEELENWAIESGFQHAVLETSIHFKVARDLYEKSGFTIIDNYGQYAGLKESVCMKKNLERPVKPSEFKDLADIEYFSFEEDFMEKNIRCIPMIVRFKMDKAGIKLKLAEWSKFSVEERIELARMDCANEKEARRYNQYLSGLVKKHTGREATPLIGNMHPAWADMTAVPEILKEILKRFGWTLPETKWRKLTALQRFALLKLCKEGHENKNFPNAMKEFGLVNEQDQ